MSSLKTLQKRDITKGMRILCRVDFNISTFDDADFTRVDAVIPEILSFVMHGAKVILISHRGDPNGREKKWSLAPLVPYLEQQLGQKVLFCASQKKEDLDQMVAEMNNGDVILLENIRFNPGEVGNNVIFAKSLARNADIFVNNAFSVCHRNNASVVAITRYLPSFAGSLLTYEVSLLEKPLKKPTILILGGIKLSTKIPLLHALESKVDHLFIGSGVAALCYAVQKGRKSFGTRVFERTELRDAEKVMKLYGDKLILPEEFIVQGKSGRGVRIGCEDIRSQHRIVDVSPIYIHILDAHLSTSHGVLWNGPLGITEEFIGKKGSVALANTLLTHADRVLLGGGDTVQFLHQQGFLEEFPNVSLGGGAMLSFMAGENMPGLTPLLKK